MIFEESYLRTFLGNLVKIRIRIRKSMKKHTFLTGVLLFLEESVVEPTTRTSSSMTMACLKNLDRKALEK
jgi:hypothetical protein